MAALAMAGQDELYAEVLEHFDRAATGKCAVLFGTTILCAQKHLGTGSYLADCIEIDEWRRDTDINAPGRRRALDNSLGQLNGRGLVRVHLPVASDKFGSHESSSGFRRQRLAPTSPRI